MIRKKVSQLKGNEVLARPIMSWDYQIILPADAIIKEDYIERLNELGIMEVYVKEDDSHESEVAILKTEVETSVKEKVKDILERHTYQNNQELAQLGAQADNIITNILEEDQVVEKIFDIKSRDTDIYEHSISICTLAILTSLKLGVDKNKIHDIGVGCLLHDIGLRYMTIDCTNRKLDDLNNLEKIEYKKHPVYGYSSLKDETWITPLSKSIILCHHEIMDGSGFPLKSKELSLECKIVSVCDTFDELICGIFCERMKVNEAIEYMKMFSGSKYDKEVVDTFLSFTAVYPSGTTVLTNEGETAIVLYQNKDFQDRPVIRVIRDKNGKKCDVIKDLLNIHNIFITRVVD